MLSTLAVQRLLRYATRITTASSSRSPAGVETDQGQVRRPIDYHFSSGWFSPEFNHDPFHREALELPPEDARPAPRLRRHRPVVRLHGSERPRRSPQVHASEEPQKLRVADGSAVVAQSDDAVARIETLMWSIGYLVHSANQSECPNFGTRPETLHCLDSREEGCA